MRDTASNSPVLPRSRHQRLVRATSDRLRRWCGAIGRLRNRLRPPAAPRALVSLVREALSHRGALSECALRLEREFLDIGARLDSTSALSAQLAGESERLDQLFRSDDSRLPPLEEATTLVRESLAFLTRCNQENEALLAELQACGRQIARLQEQGAELERVFSALRSVEVFFRVETATLPAQSQSVFLTLTAGMAGLQVQVEAGFGREFERLETTRRTLTQLAGEIAATVEDQRQQSAARLRAIDTALAGLAARQSGQQQSQQAIVATVESISGHSALLVTSLQYQDITRQKMEHVESALADLDAIPAHGRTSADAVRRASETSRLEAEQLGGVLSDLAAAHAQLRSASAAILEDLASLDRTLDGDSGRGDLVGALETTAETLLHALADLQILTAEADRGAHRAVEAVSSFAQLAETVAGESGTLAVEIQLIALNAQVQAAQVAQGGALEVLAHETCRAAVQIDGLARSLSGEVAEVNAQLRQVSQRCGNFRERTAGHCALLQTATPRLTSGVRAQCAAASTCVGSLREIREQLAEQARSWSGDTSVPEIEQFLRQFQRILLQVSSTAPVHESRSGIPAEGNLVGHSRRYTTEAERRIHRSVVGAAAAEEAASPDAEKIPSPEAVQPGSGSTGEPLGDNVELF